MSAVKYDPQGDIKFLIERLYSSDEELAKENQVDGRIANLVKNLTSVDAHRFGKIPIKFKVKILTQFQEVLQKEQNVKAGGEIDSNLTKFLSNDDELRGELFKKGMFKDAILKTYFRFSPQGDELFFSSNYLTPDQVKQMFASLDPKVKEKVKSLNFSNNSCIKDLAFLKGFSNLMALNLSHSFTLDSLCGLEECPKLTRLNISNCAKLTSLDGIEALESLAEINAASCARLDNISALLAKCPKSLKTLDLSNCPRLENLEPILEQLISLESLKIRHLPDLFTVSFVPKLIKLTYLDVSYSRLQNLTGLIARKPATFLFEGCKQLAPHDLDILRAHQKVSSDDAKVKK